MSLPNFPFASQSTAVVLEGDFHAPDDAAIGIGDYFAAAVSADAITFTRPVVDGQGFETANPGARVRFVTNSSRLQLVLRYTNLVTRSDTYNGLGAVLVNGTLFDTFDRFKGAAGTIVADISLGSATSRTIDVVMPYCASVDFLGVYVDAGATFSAASARPSTRLLCIGDSITHGFNATAQHLSWPFLLAQAKGWQLFNHGYGGAQISAAAVTAAIAGMPASPSVGIILEGFNNFYPQTPLATVRTACDACIDNWQAGAPGKKLYVVTPTWTSHVPGDGVVVPGSNLIDDYRQQWRDAVTAASDANIILIEGTSLATGDALHFPDLIHPNDTASAQMATALGLVVSP